MNGFLAPASAPACALIVMRTSIHIYYSKATRLSNFTHVTAHSWVLSNTPAVTSDQYRVLSCLDLQNTDGHTHTDSPAFIVKYHINKN